MEMKSTLIVGAIDFGGQVLEGENVASATNKALLHYGTGVVIGAALTALGVSAFPALVVGAIIGTVVNGIVDEAYDSFIEKAGNFVGSLFSWE